MSVTAKFMSNKDRIIGARIVGYEKTGARLYVARAIIQGGLHLGKWRSSWKQAAIPYGGKEVWVSDFEVWVGKLSNGFDGSWRGQNHYLADAVACGNEADGTPLYIARAKHEGGLHPGKWRKDSKLAAISYGGVEIWKSDFQVLVSGITWAEPVGVPVED